MRRLHDRFFNQAKREGKLARSVYKLAELDRREKLFRRRDRVLDLGASPGSWLEYILEAIGPEGAACAVDLQPIHRKFKGRAHFLLRDARELRGDEFVRIAPGGFDALVSDMAPNTSGIRIVDQARSLELCGCALDLAGRLLREGGNFACKIFCGPETEAFRRRAGGFFKTARLRKPAACRTESIEAYFIGLDFVSGRYGNGGRKVDF
ncbi:MAG: RlmE family RNA methyltransferase [Planctomycetota bacterium]|jgi:23S rRNA (uridine2552-2'-O)-methyltransferase|nr:RlmE family RNA methyltransferase [Planctomycetota bacterium]